MRVDAVVVVVVPGGENGIGQSSSHSGDDCVGQSSTPGGEVYVGYFFAPRDVAACTSRDTSTAAQHTTPTPKAMVIPASVE